MLQCGNLVRRQLCLFFCLFCREDLAQIALYNMTIDHNTKYYDFYDELMPWINTNWDLISPGKVCVVKPINVKRMGALQEEYLYV